MITYETIIEYLSPIINTFSNQQNITLYSPNFKFFSNIFDHTFYRYGIVNTSNNVNISLENSISYCLDTNVKVNGSLWDISNNIHINIIIFDFKNNVISSTYFGDFFNPWRPTIFLANYNEWWEPIVSNDTKIFSYSSNKSIILKTKILSNIQNIIKYNSTDTIQINDNFNEILEIDQFINTNDTFVNNTTFSKNKLEKMKKDELIQIINNMNMIIPMVKPTKKDLIQIICKD